MLFRSVTAPAPEHHSAQALPPVAPQAPVAPGFAPVNDPSRSPFPAGNEPAAPGEVPVQQAPITGVPMSFPADLRGPAS